MQARVGREGAGPTARDVALPKCPKEAAGRSSRCIRGKRGGGWWSKRPDACEIVQVGDLDARQLLRGGTCRERPSRGSGPRASAAEGESLRLRLLLDAVLGQPPEPFSEEELERVRGLSKCTKGLDVRPGQRGGWWWQQGSLSRGVPEYPLSGARRGAHLTHRES